MRLLSAAIIALSSLTSVYAVAATTTVANPMQSTTTGTTLSTTSSAAPATTTTTTVVAAPTTSTTTHKATKGAKTSALNATPAVAGGGAGQVWVNAGTKVYHCKNSKWYGKTKKGQYLAVADAQAKGFHADKGEKCDL